MADTHLALVSVKKERILRGKILKITSFFWNEHNYDVACSVEVNDPTQGNVSNMSSKHTGNGPGLQKTHIMGTALAAATKRALITE